jgi:uncharacterized membrane protein YkvA (DUF1232 family)
MNWLRAWAHRVRVDAHAVWLAARDPRTPWPARAMGLAVAAYALSPIDLIPDFVPVLGLLDDLVLLPLGVWLFARMVPAPLFAEHRLAAERASERPVSRGGALIILLIWAIAAIMIGLHLRSWRYW